MFNFEQIEGSVIKPQMIEPGTYYEFFDVYEVKNSLDRLVVAKIARHIDDAQSADYVEMLYMKKTKGFFGNIKEEHFTRQAIWLDEYWCDDGQNTANHYLDFALCGRENLEFIGQEFSREIEVNHG